MRLARLGLAAGVAAGALIVAAPASATNECRGLNPCVAVAGPWVVVPTGPGTPRIAARYELSCPRGWVVGGTDAELSDRAIDLAFFGTSGSPVSPGITTARTMLFVGTYAGAGGRAPTFRPHIGCVPTSGGGQRTPTSVAAVFPPGAPTLRRVVTAHVGAPKRVAASCRADERLVDWYATRAFGTPAPPPPALVAGLSVRAAASGRTAVAVARAARGEGIVQVGAVCTGAPR
ncbi:MAG TPA: hypothetical protein VFB26_11515 [Gaiellaceae bacterium]|nr:hypothetical protein [Gaiellaceae bacterium]